MDAADAPLPAGSPVVWSSATLTNRGALAEELALPAGSTDASIVAAAHGHWGGLARDHLRGAWAYAVTDPDTGEVIITRDHLGLRPAYWARDAHGALHIDDSLQALADLAGVDLTPDAEYAKAVELRASGLLPDRTGALGIRCVPAGSAVRLRGADARITRWWRVEDTPRVGRIDIEEAAAQLRALLLAAVEDTARACLPPTLGSDDDAGANAADGSAADGHDAGGHDADGHDAAGHDAAGHAANAIAAHVSGGMDSTVVALIAQDCLRRSGRSLACVVSWSPDSASVPAASITGSPLPFDERDLVQALADEMDVPAVFGPGIAGEAPWLAALDGLTQPRRTVARESHVLPIVAGLGVHHVLSGWGGDEFASFNGRATNRQLVRTLRLGPLREAYRDLRARRRSPLRAVADLAREGLPAGLSRRRGAALPDHVVQRERDLARAAADFPALVARYRVFEAAQSGARGPRDYQLALLASGHLTRRVEAWHEAGRRFGVQYHHPLLDPRIVEWALSMPPEVFRTGGHSRRVFRLAVRGLVPEAVRLSTKDDPVLLRFLQQAGPAGG